MKIYFIIFKSPRLSHYSSSSSSRRNGRPSPYHAPSVSLSRPSAHTFAMWLRQNGVDLYTVQKLGRWKTVTMVRRYAHHHTETLRASVEKLDEVKKPIITNLSHLQKIKGRQPVLRVVTP
ncbi:MAG: tyrosine-type recombinase/integrase [Deltaproteobacteria bacterium]|nr:tyrosine-type recombinase/integrase [Deltaproteobacteria bacterium]